MKNGSIAGMLAGTLKTSGKHVASLLKSLHDHTILFGGAMQSVSRTADGVSRSHGGKVTPRLYISHGGPAYQPGMVLVLLLHAVVAPLDPSKVALEAWTDQGRCHALFWCCSHFRNRESSTSGAALGRLPLRHCQVSRWDGPMPSSCSTVLAPIAFINHRR